MAQVLLSLEFMSQRRFLDVFKRLKCVDFILIGLVLSSIVPCFSMEGNGSTHISDNDTSLRSTTETWRLADIPAQNLKSFQEILQILEKLNMIKHSGNVSDCFFLDRIMREVSSSSTFPRKIGIHFYFEESEIDSGDTVFLDKNTVSGNIINTNRNLKTGNCNKGPTISDIHGLDRLSRKQGDNNQRNASESTSNKTMTDASGAQQMGDGTTSQYDKGRGLSRTQVVVIATCSSVIGTFFIIAGAIRIHNCMRRYRANREAALVNARRTSTFGFGGSVNIRRDSASSKASRQQSHPASKAGSDTQVDRNGRSQHPNSHNSPQHCSDHNPLLPARLVGQFSDGSSSHGSLAFIDEESHSKSKQNDNYSGSDLGSEDDPLLRKSPDSGSSIDIGMEDNGKVDVSEEHMKSSFSSDIIKGRDNESPKRVLKSPDRTVVFEPGGDTSSESNRDTRQDELTKDNCKDLHTDSDKPNSKTYEEKTNNSEGLEKIVSKLGESQNPKVNLNTDISPMKKNKLPLKQFSVDYFDVDDNGFEIQNPIFEEINDRESCGHLSENHAVTTGLSQSDSSLSNNPSYCYGNQTEYDNNGGYGQIGYACPYYIKPGNDIYWLDTDLIQNSLRNSELLSAECLRRENGDLSESFDEAYLAESNRRSSLAEESNRTKYPRMFSTDSYFSNPVVNKLSPLERSHSASPDDVSETSTATTESTSRTRDLHIVPLEEYHRNSLKEMSDEEDAV